MNQYPDYYKFFSLEVNLNEDLKQIDRETYSMLDWLGDIGGLIEALKVFGEVIISSMSMFAFKSRLASLIVSF